MPAEIKVFTQQNLQGNRVVNVGAPVDNTDVATKASAQAQADAAKSAAEATATSLASAAQAAAISAAAADATTKANAAVSTANAYTDTQVLAANATVLSSANTYTDGKITALINGAPTALDTLNELATALGNNESAVTALTNSIATVSGNLATETTNRTNADTALQTSITGIDGRLTTAESQISSLSGSMTAFFEGTATGAGTLTSNGYEYTINHALNKTKIIVQVYEGNDVVDVAIKKVDSNNVKIITGSALGSTTLTVVVIG
jgi:hypothetical protein